MDNDYRHGDFDGDRAIPFDTARGRTCRMARKTAAQG